ncbi:MAG: dihydrofolate reductase family protein [Actinomycetota bacterium]|nr:dihydrofolate reductase family protein [Actinomycetota bacterium]
MLCEGGPTLTARLLEDGALDELFLTVGPLLTGDDREPSIVAGAGLTEPARLELRWVLRQGSELFLRYAVVAPGG